MSLSKQLLLLISALFLMVFSINFASSVNNIREYLKGEAKVHVQDTATSLGLSLSPYLTEDTDPIIETMMNAIFDMGYYQQIKLVSVEQKPLVVLTNKTEVEGVPDWFVKMLPMETISAESEISTGWNITGVIYVTFNSGYAYHKLYEQAKTSFYYSIATFVLSIILLLIVLRMTLSSLKNLDQMALRIVEGEFETIDQSPWTTEVRNVTTSMNMMCRKIEGVISNLNKKLAGIGKKLQQDELTGLNKKSSFELDMKDLFEANDAIEAYIFMIKIDGLNALVKELGNNAIDEFLKDFSQALTDIAEQNHWGEVLVYRFVGSEFVVLVKSMTGEQTKQLAGRLSLAFSEVGEKYQHSDIAHIGVARFNSAGSIESNLSASKEAYEQAQLIGPNSFFIRTMGDPAKDIAEWKDLVFCIVDNQQYNVLFVGSVEDFITGKTLMEETSTEVEDKNGNSLSIGTFVSIAEKFNKIVELDKSVILKAIEYIEKGTINYSIAISLSTRTIKNSDFRSWLVELVKLKQSISQQLVFSLSAYAVAKEFSTYKEFIEFTRRLDVRVMIKRFDTQSLSPELAKELRPDFIRLTRDLGQGIANDDRKIDFVETMKGIGDLLDISILAENVNTDDDFMCIQSIGITGASR